MTQKQALPLWTIVAPVAGLVLLLLDSFLPDNFFILIIKSTALIISVMTAVHHAEVVAHKVGEPFGTLVLAIAVTVIEVALIVSLMIAAGDSSSALARDTVFAAIMIILTGIIGICLLTGGVRFKEQAFIRQGTNASLIVLIAIITLTLILPNYTTSVSGPFYNKGQLIFVAVVSLILYGAFVAVQTVRHRDYFLPPEADIDDKAHAAPPSKKQALTSFVLLVVCLTAVVLLAKKLSPAIEAFVNNIGAPIDDALLNAKTDYTSILYQASVFNKQCRVFAPRYRQAHIKNFFRKDKEKAAIAFDTAYADLKKAFEYYLDRWNNGRPLIIAGHSQGGMMAERLLKDYFENKAMHNKLVVAYVVGWPVTKQYFSAMEMCKDSLQTSCLCSWRTLRRGYIPTYMKKEKGNSYATNPLIWTSDNTYASKKRNNGSVLVKFNKVYKYTTDAQVIDGLLFIKRPKFPWSFLYLTKNYHPGDINLFYVNMQEDIKRRIKLYWKR